MMRPTLLTVILTLWVAPTVAAQPDLEEARALLAREEFDRALEAFGEILEARPDHREALLGRAEVYLALGEFSEAEIAASRLLDRNAEDAEAKWLLARTLYLQADELRGAEIPSNLAIRTRYSDAERFATDLLEGDPSNLEVRKFRAAARFWLEDLDGAAEDYLVALEAEPDDPDLLFDLGNLEARYRGRYEQAIPHLEKAIELRPDFFEAHAALGLAHQGRGDLDLAVTRYVEALEIRPNDPEIYGFLWDLFGTPDRYQDGLEAYERILASSPENFTAHWHRAHILKGQERFGKAIAACEAVLEEKPDWTDVTNFVANLQIQRDESDAAAEVWLTTLESDPENEGAREGLLGMARSLGEQKKYEQALEIFDRLVKQFPEDVTIRADRALTLFNMGRTEEAIQGYEDALRIDPQDSQVLNDLGLVYQGIREYSKAIEMFLKAIEIDRNLDAEENHAVLLYKFDETAKALNRFERILWVDPSRERSMKYYLECRRLIDLDLKQKNEGE